MDDHYKSEEQLAKPDSNSTSIPLPSKCLHTLFEVQAASTPDAPAVTFADTSLSYRELNQRANALAYHLKALGVAPETMVAIHMDRSLELMVALLGILKAGGAYVPLDPHYPRERLLFMLEETHAPVLLTQSNLENELSGHDAKVICLEPRDWSIASPSEGEANPHSGATLENLAYVIYTSGSTGQPKGVMNTHRGICNRLQWMQAAYHLTSADTVLQKTPISFDVSVWELFWPLLNGARLVLARPGGHQDSAYLVDVIANEHITVLHFVPSMLQVFLEERQLDRCVSVRDVMCSGEALSVALQERFFERMTARLHNLYGPTEAAVDVTFWPCMRNSGQSTVPIGYPVANTQIYILDARLKPAPVGEAGELHIGGVQVARGYLKRPGLTTEKFIQDPFSADPQGRLYKTGDLARYLPDGSLEFLGRIDYQVKLRGFRIELGEIETVLSRHPSVLQVVVVATKQGAITGGLSLVAYLLCDGPMPSPADLRHFLSATLPDYMVPGIFVEMDAWPLTPNGKLDRQALPEPSRKRPALEQAYVPPRNRLERYLADLWRETLRLNQIGVYDRFFELGGDSLLAAQIINALQQDLGESIFIVSMFEAPTIAEYATFLEEHYTHAVAERFRRDLRLRRNAASIETAHRIDAAAIERMRQLLPAISLIPNDVADELKNPPAIFILAPPRSGTTLLRVMLAGHPDLFACSELQLLGFHSLEERQAALTGKHSLWLEGTLRALMDIHACDAETAKQMMRNFEQQKLTTTQFYGLLQEAIEGRILVDKSPFYALDLETLKKAERAFREPLYIHLVRHPYAMVRSFEAYHFDQVLRMDDAHTFSRRELGELVWTISHQNILTFLRDIPEHRKFCMRFEALVNEPRPVLEQMCKTLELDFHPGFLEPYKNQEKKMVDGIHAVSTSMGDKKFQQHQRINPEAAQTWEGVETDDFLGDVTWQVAQMLGYDTPSSRRPFTNDAARAHETMLSSRDRREMRMRRRLTHRLSGPDKEL